MTDLLLDDVVVPAALEIPTTPAVEEKPKPKRKSYYVPVAEREAARKKASAAKKVEKTIRSAGTSTKKTAAPKKKEEEPSKKGRSGSDLCSICHKPLSKHTSVQNGMGDTCASKIKLLPKGVTLEEHYEKLSVVEVPKGWIKFSEAFQKAKKKGCSGYRFLQACGGDRMLRPPFSKLFKVVIFKNVRYIDPACLNHLKEIEKV